MLREALERAKWQLDILSYSYFQEKRRSRDHKTIALLEAMLQRLYPNYSLNFRVNFMFTIFREDKLLDLYKTTLEAYIVFADLIKFERLRLNELYLRVMIRYFIVLTFFLSLKLDISDRKAKIQEIKANIRDKYYKGNCKAKIGITPDPGRELKVCITPFERWAYCG